MWFDRVSLQPQLLHKVIVSERVRERRYPFFSEPIAGDVPCGDVRAEWREREKETGGREEREREMNKCPVCVSERDI